MINTTQTLDKPVTQSPVIGLTFTEHYDNACDAVREWFSVDDPFRLTTVESWAIPEGDPRRSVPKSQQVSSVTLSVMAHLAKSNPSAIANCNGIITLTHWMCIVRTVLNEKAGLK